MVSEAHGSGTPMMTDGKKSVNLAEKNSEIPIMNMVKMDTAVQKGEAVVESTVTHLRGYAVETY